MTQRIQSCLIPRYDILHNIELFAKQPFIDASSQFRVRLLADLGTYIGFQRGQGSSQKLHHFHPCPLCAFSECRIAQRFDDGEGGK
jgi:hypothetical protein